MKHFMLLLFMVFILIGNFSNAEDQEPEVLVAPDTEIHIFDLRSIDGNYLVSKGKNISKNKGYDNQPYFSSDNESLYFVSMRGSNQTDVYQYHLKSGKTQQITDTSYDEYSPKVGMDDNHITFVSEGSNPYQSVWQLNLNTGDSSWLLNSKEPVGYYQVNHQSGDVLLWSRYGWSVQYLNIKKNLNRFVSGNALPSSPQQIPGTSLFSFVHRQSNGEVWIKSFDPSNFAVTPIAPINSVNFDYGWSGQGEVFWMTENVLHRWSLNKSAKGWQVVADLSGYFEGNAGRLTVSSDGLHLAIVENK